jgi:Na+/H+ antiporter NhaD/arsenite permease-like protein
MTTATVRLLVFIAAYVALAFPTISGMRLSRPAVAAAGAVLMLLVGRLPLHEAYAAIDVDVLVFLLGMLIAAAYLDTAGVFEWAAEQIVRHVTDNPYVLLAVVVGVCGVASAFFMNDTICLVFTPLVVATLRPLGMKPVPFLLGVALASNVGSAMAITGNPQNMIIGLASHIGFAAFLAALALPSLGGLLLVYGVLVLVFRRDLEVVTGPPAAIIPRAIDRRAAIVASAVFAGMLVAWLLGYSLPLVSIGGGVALLMLAGRDMRPVLARVDWTLLVFFAGLFVIVGGVRDVPLVERATSVAIHALDGRPWRDATVLSGAMLVLSNIVSNVPAVLLWRPVIPALPDARFLWLVLAMSATFAGNLTLLGSLANLIVAERAEAEGATLSFADYLRAGIPVTLLTIGWGIVALVLVVGR